MIISLSIQNSYKTLEISLYKDENIIDSITEPNIRTSKELIPLINDILQKNNFTLANLSFIAINQGPGAFITLRVLIATVNGISFASKVPLIGIDGLEATLLEYENSKFPINIVLLNAFNNEVYYAIKKDDTITKGYKDIKELLQELSNIKQNMFFVGNGAELFKKEITDTLANLAHFPQEIPETCSSKQVGLMALEKFNTKKEISNQLMPLYLKSLTYKKSIIQ